MDEPTSALDPISTLKIEDLALELKQNYTIVIVTHNMQQAVRISDKTAFFLLGEVVEFNDTDSLFSNPQEKRLKIILQGGLADGKEQICGSDGAFEHRTDRNGHFVRECFGACDAGFAGR